MVLHMIENETIAAISTPESAGGIAMIRISGAKALEIADTVFQAANGTKPTQMRGYTCSYGTVLNGTEAIDDVILTCFRAPHSYTGEDTVEITCHGGIYLTKKILSLLFEKGAVPAGPGEFTKRAFLNGKMTLSQAEAVMSVIAADGETALRQANLAKQGRLGKKMREASDALISLLSAMAYWMDDAEEFPPELERGTLEAQIHTIREELQNLSDTYDNGRILREGIRTVLLGRPNAGKSTVMNWLCGIQRSIVTDIAGTTRDVVTEQVKIGSYKLLLSDTAGIRETDHPIEAIGIAQAYDALSQAELVLYVVDAQTGLTAEDMEVLQKCGNARVLLLWNKSDLSDSVAPDCGLPTSVISAKHGRGYEEILSSLTALFPAGQSSVPVIMNERQKALVDTALVSLTGAENDLLNGADFDMISVQLETAAQKLRELDGDLVTEDIIEGVFSKFCVGK